MKLSIERGGKGYRIDYWTTIINRYKEKRQRGAERRDISWVKQKSRNWCHGNQQSKSSEEITMSIRHERVGWVVMAET